jgi:Rps23 Pro-64 3,4-dihydroxylase Tpa1-like proline 4-hydroxylase
LKYSPEGERNVLNAHLTSETGTPGQSQVSNVNQADVGAYKEQFEGAQPFKHLIIEDFFNPAFAETLLTDFPVFDREKAMNEFGEVGGKAVNEAIAEISPAYSRLYTYLKSAQFLQLMSDLTGIPDLLPDPNMYGGGTHENRHGQELDAHVDFNYDPPTKLHRRLNLLVYLNKGWKVEWGGAIELHSDPRHPDNNRISAFSPDFNRALIFETNEYSWHGFPKINLPEDKQHLSRKSISIYLYTRDRPANEIVPEHGTFYVQRPLPEYIQAGHTLSAQDVKDLKDLLVRRDSWIEHYQGAQLVVSGQMGTLNDRIRELSERANQGVRTALARSLRFRLSRLLGTKRS